MSRVKCTFGKLVVNFGHPIFAFLLFFFLPNSSCLVGKIKALTTFLTVLYLFNSQENLIYFLFGNQENLIWALESVSFLYPNY